MNIIYDNVFGNFWVENIIFCEMQIAKENVKIMNECIREMRDRECASNLVDENETSSWKNQHKTQMNS